MIGIVLRLTFPYKHNKAVSVNVGGSENLIHSKDLYLFSIYNKIVYVQSSTSTCSFFNKPEKTIRMIFHKKNDIKMFFLRNRNGY